MKILHKLCAILLNLVLVLAILVEQSEKQVSCSMDGDGKPFGSTGPYSIIDEVDQLDTKTFFSQYVNEKEAVVMRGIVSKFPATKLWTDEYLYAAAKDYDAEKLVVESVKKESRDQQILELSLREFLNAYKRQEIYMVNPVPNYIRKDVPLPQPLQCGEAPKSLEETMMWFSSGGTSSVIHTDDYENILCIFDGTKQVILVDSNRYSETVDSIIDEPKGSYSHIDVDKVDYSSYPGIEKLEYYRVNLTTGDCLYIPFKWLHQVRSYDRNLAINFWFNNEKIFNAQFPEECENNVLDMSKTLDKYEYSPAGDDHLLSFKYFLIRLVNGGKRKYSDWKKFMFDDIKMQVQDGKKEEAESITKELFDFLDLNGNGYISNEELTELDDIRLDHLNSLFEEIYMMFDTQESEDDYDNDSDHNDDTLDHNEL